jgi:hypothetical protein
MPHYAVDFKTLKTSITLQETIKFLGLTLKRSDNGFTQWRGQCIACKPNDKQDRSLVVTEGRGAYCHHLGRGGDQIWLVSHICNISNREAAESLVPLIDDEHAKYASRKAAVPQEQRDKEKAPTPTAPNVPTPLAPLTYLQYDHEAVQSLGFDPDTAERLGVGFASKGMMRGLIAFPLYDHGELVGYAGVPAGTAVKLPRNLLPPQSA